MCDVVTNWNMSLLFALRVFLSLSRLLIISLFVRTWDCFIAKCTLIYTVVPLILLSLFNKLCFHLFGNLLLAYCRQISLIHETINKPKVHVNIHVHTCVQTCLFWCKSAQQKKTGCVGKSIHPLFVCPLDLPCMYCTCRLCWCVICVSAFYCVTLLFPEQLKILPTVR